MAPKNRLLCNKIFMYVHRFVLLFGFMCTLAQICLYTCLVLHKGLCTKYEPQARMVTKWFLELGNHLYLGRLPSDDHIML